MKPNAGRTSRTRSTLIMVILATIPCYCLGYIMLNVGRVARQVPTATATVTHTVRAGRRTNTPGPTRTSIIFPTATNQPTETITWTPSVTYTPFVPPTRTPTTFIPPTNTPVPTSTPVPTQTPSPTPPPPTETPTATNNPS